jgi:hypothetical protein
LKEITSLYRPGWTAAKLNEPPWVDEVENFTSVSWYNRKDAPDKTDLSLLCTFPVIETWPYARLQIEKKNKK